MHEMQDYFFYNARRLRALYTSPSHFFSFSTAVVGANAAGPNQAINIAGRSSSAPLNPSNPHLPVNNATTGSAAPFRLSSAPPESRLYNGSGGVRAIEAWQARVREQVGARAEEERFQRDEEEVTFRQKERERMKPVLEAYYRHKRRWHPEGRGGVLSYKVR